MVVWLVPLQQSTQGPGRVYQASNFEVRHLKQRRVKLRQIVLRRRKMKVSWTQKTLIWSWSNKLIQEDEDLPSRRMMYQPWTVSYTCSSSRTSHSVTCYCIQTQNRTHLRGKLEWAILVNLGYVMLSYRGRVKMHSCYLLGSALKGLVSKGICAVCWLSWTQHWLSSFFSGIIACREGFFSLLS